MIQYTGRLHRPHPRKMDVQIFDYVDRGVPMLLKMFERRLRAYRAIGYEQVKPGEPTGALPGGRVDATPQLPIMTGVRNEASQSAEEEGE